MNECCNTKHPSHATEIGRLNRVSGQIEGIKNMIEEQRYCPDIIAQLRAVQSATKAIETNILRKHIDMCVREAFASNTSDEKIEELIKIFKKLD